MDKKFLWSPQFWVNVVTLVFVGFLVATFVFGWNPPTVAPPGGGGAIQVNAQNDIFVGNKPDATKRRIKNVENPLDANDAATRGWVLSASAGSLGVVTLWGRCQSSTCDAGENSFGPNPPETALDCQQQLGDLWTELYRGFGPYVVYEDNPPLPGVPGPLTLVDSVPICRLGSVDDNPFYVGVAGGPVEYKFYAKWSAGSGEYANTCVVCGR